MLIWLDHHAAAVQALAAIATLIVTGWLARLTGQYVRLTRDIARASADQARLLGEATRKAQEIADSSLRAHAGRLRASLEGLSRTEPGDTQLRHFTLITQSHVDTLEVLARQKDDDARGQAVLAAMALHTIVGMAERVRGVKANYGYGFSQQEKSEYAAAMTEAIQSLERLAGVSEAKG